MFTLTTKLLLPMVSCNTPNDAQCPTPTESIGNYIHMVVVHALIDIFIFWSKRVVTQWAWRATLNSSSEEPVVESVLQKKKNFFSICNSRRTIDTTQYLVSLWGIAEREARGSGQVSVSLVIDIQFQS